MWGGVCALLTEFYRTIHAQENVVTLDISMNHLIRMEEVQSL